MPWLVVGHDLDGARLVAGVHPHQSVAFLPLEVLLRGFGVAAVDGHGQILGAATLAHAVDKQFSLGIVGVDKHRCDLAFASGPGPVGQDVEGFLILVPVAAVEVVAVFGYACEVDDAEQRAVAWPVGVVGCGFAEIVEACPHELADAVGQILVLDEVILGQVGHPQCSTS